jgi:cytoskeletal protein CcmA (bactofilin family)
MSNPYDNTSEKMSVLGPTLVFKGELSADEDLMLRGRVEGAITQAPTLRIGADGSVQGNVHAQYVNVEGAVEGDLHASGSLTVQESANVRGNIFSPKVSLIEGARFKGSIDMDVAEQSSASTQSNTSAKVAASA